MGPCTELYFKLLVYCGILMLVRISGCECRGSGSYEIKESKPNIVIFIADDMGFDDVSIHGSNQIPTPNIDSLGIMGIQLNGMYVAPQCTPSRSSLMTGKYASNLGMQNALAAHKPYGLGLGEKTIAQYMKDAGYGTHLIGKWHLGFYEKVYTPILRGFDSHFGYLGGLIDYYNHSFIQPTSKFVGFDMRNNLEVSWETIGRYATDLFTEKAVEMIQNHDKSSPMFMILSHLAPHAGNDYAPLQALIDKINEFDYIKDEKRRTYEAMVSKLDESVGHVVEALDTNDMLDNSIILFMSDNGAPVYGPFANTGSNYPFRGQKSSPWQGAVRSAAAIWSPRLKCRQRVSNQMIHMSDWLPTFAEIAGVKINDKIDGLNVWEALSNDSPSPRKDVLVHYDNMTPYMAYISENFKLVSGSNDNGIYDGWLFETVEPPEQNVSFGNGYSDAILSSNSGRALLKFSKSMTKDEIDETRREAQVTCNGHAPPASNFPSACNLLVGPCLFEISDDPCETINLASVYPDIVTMLQANLEYYASIAPPILDHPGDLRCNPAKFGGIWTWWYDELDETNHSIQAGRNTCSQIAYPCFHSTKSALFTSILLIIYSRMHYSVKMFV